MELSFFAKKFITKIENLCQILLSKDEKVLEQIIIFENDIRSDERRQNIEIVCGACWDSSECGLPERRESDGVWLHNTGNKCKASEIYEREFKANPK